MSSAAVASKTNTYRVKTRAAMPWTLPPWSAFAASRPSGDPTTALPTATTSRTPKLTPAITAQTRWPRMVSTRESAASTPTSISTNRNSIKMAPV